SRSARRAPDDRAGAKPGARRGPSAAAGNRRDRAARWPLAHAPHARRARHSRQPDEPRGGRGQGARSHARPAWRGTRARAGGGMPPDRVQSGHQRIRPALSAGFGGNTITMARSMPGRFLTRCALVAAGVVLTLAPARADDFYKGKSINLIIA